MRRKMILEKSYFLLLFAYFQEFTNGRNGSKSRSYDMGLCGELSGDRKKDSEASRPELPRQKLGNITPKDENIGFFELLIFVALLFIFLFFFGSAKQAPGGML